MGDGPALRDVRGRVDRGREGVELVGGGGREGERQGGGGQVGHRVELGGEEHSRDVVRGVVLLLLLLHSTPRVGEVMRAVGGHGEGGVPGVYPAPHHPTVGGGLGVMLYQVCRPRGGGGGGQLGDMGGGRAGDRGAALGWRGAVPGAPRHLDYQAHGARWRPAGGALHGPFWNGKDEEE